MGRDRWRRVQELFEAAADLRPSQQAAYLATACGGDDDLRREVEGLLRSDAEAGSFIEHAIRRGSDLLLAAEPDPLEALGKIGKYEILGRIGEGGFGVVYKGRDAVLQRYVAVKTCSSSNEKLRRRFFREGQIAAGLQHTNITTVHDLGVERGVPYLVQEFLAGEDLNHMIARQEGLNVLRRLDILAQVARGLEYAHLQGVLHRDVKPANIRILPSGAVKIMDFGIAKLLHEVSDVTTQGVTVGTVGYLAPEQLRGEEVDRRTDIFSFGVLAYELLTYERPFKGSTFSEVSYRLLNEEPAALRDLAPIHSQAIAELARRCLAKDPAQRYASFGEILAVLEPEIAALRSGPFPLLQEAPEAPAAPRAG
ncbi:MAG TPA: serine/threonine-protein kinase, partial [Thermoanaerobaculia bacterium]|nr:serine/threonine-protein kinase [Thermoanaerobaculia bacterium]